MAGNRDNQGCYVGVDLGGTKIYTGIFNEDLQCVGAARLSTKSERGVAAVIGRIARCVQEAVDECDLTISQIKGIGIGAPGAVDPDNGRVIFAPNLDWKDVPLCKELETHLGTKVYIENDCTMAMLGIYEAELGGSPPHVIGLFLGTGIGGGLVINSHIYSGFAHAAGEVGHMVLDVNGPQCTCGNKGCFEALASRTAILNRIRAAVKDGQQTLLTDIVGPDLKDLRSKDLRKAIRRGDKFVREVVDEAAKYTGIAIANLLNILNPELVILGGGIIEALETQMMPIIYDTAMDYVMPGTGKGISIYASKLGDDAGITGGAVLARNASE